MRLPLYTKTIVAVVMAVVSVVTPSLGGDQILDSTELTQIGIAILTALGVYALPNGYSIREGHEVNGSVVVR